MQVVYPRCCGLDVPKQSVVACRLLPGPDGEPRREIRTFGTMTDDLLALADWLTQAGVTHVAMESTGVYGKPVYNLLEGSLELLVVNAAPIQAVPGRKTEIQEAEWIADLLRHGLLRPSFIPDRPQRQLRDLCRYRTALVREHSAEVHRIQQCLEGANIQLSSVATDITGVSGRAILQAWVAGQTQAAALAQMARGRMRPKIPELERALSGRFGRHEQFLIAEQLGHLSELEERIERLSQAIREPLARMGKPEGPGSGTLLPGEPPVGENGLPEADADTGQPSVSGPGPTGYVEAVQRLQTIPGVGERVAERIVAEIGVEMSRFPSAGHLAAWAGVAPGTHESAGKRKSGRTRKGSRWLREVLVEAAKAAGRTKGTYLGAQYRRLVGRRGKKRATIAAGHTILVIAYHLLRDGTIYEELGANYLDQGDHEGVKRRAIRRLEDLGYTVTVEAKVAA